MSNFYGATSLIGGGSGALDAIDGAGLSDGDGALVIASGYHFTYVLDDDSAAAESSPDIIAPDDNPGDKRWILVPPYADYSNISGNDPSTNVTGAELEELTDTSETTLHSHVASDELVSAAPVLTFENTTATDAEGGRVSILRFKGKQSGGETTVLAELHTSHSGTSDDTRGKVTLYVNNGEGGLAKVLEIKDDGDATFERSVLVSAFGNYYHSGTQVVGPRVVDARCDDAVNSGDATTDGVIDALRDAMITHGLIEAGGG